VPEEGEDPQRVGRPPVALVAVEDDRRVAGDALGAEEPREGLALDEIPLDRVVEVGMPVDLDRRGDVAGLVEQHVLIRFGDDETRFAEVLLQPFGRHETLRVGVLGETRCWIDLEGHAEPPIVPGDGRGAGKRDEER
jgi:hypothetical protein